MWLLDYLQWTIYRFAVRIAWLVSDLLGWPAAMTVYPAVMQGKVAIVTGANSGIGFETTKALLQVGHNQPQPCMSCSHTISLQALCDHHIMMVCDGAGHDLSSSVTSQWQHCCFQ